MIADVGSMIHFRTALGRQSDELDNSPAYTGNDYILAIGSSSIVRNAHRQWQNTCELYNGEHHRLDPSI